MINDYDKNNLKKNLQKTSSQKVQNEVIADYQRFRLEWGLYIVQCTYMYSCTHTYVQYADKQHKVS